MLNTTDCILTAQHSQACIKPKGQTIVLIGAVTGIRAEAAGISDRSTHHVDWRARLPLANILHHTIKQPLPGFAGTPGIVGGNQQVGDTVRQQRMRHRRRFAAEHIQPGPTKLPTAQRLRLCRLINQPAAGGVQQHCAGFHLRQKRRVH